MRAVVALGILAVVGCAAPHGPPPDGLVDTIRLNGVSTSVAWSDGDTFVITSGLFGGSKARLRGVNTLETYGPVHRWGEWTREELLTLARGSAAVAAEATETCRATGARDKYKRLLVDCEDAKAELLRSGHGHLYPFDRDADPADIALQAEAKRERRGMWAKGIPSAIVTKVDAASAENGYTAGNWVVSTDDGSSRRIGHRDEHAVCDEVCVGRPPAVPSCLVFVPYERRYVDPAPCLLAAP